MIIIAGYFDVPPERRDEFLAMRKALILRSRAEGGCDAYTFSADTVDPGRVWLYEEWQSQEHLDAHKVVLAANPLPDFPVISRNVRYYDVIAQDA